MIYEKDEINIIGIIPDRDLNNEAMSTDTDELYKIFYDALCIGPMYRPLIKLLEEKEMIETSTNRIYCRDVLKVLNSNKYLTNCPNYVSSRETVVNIKLVTTALIIRKYNFLSVDTIRHALNAFELECKFTKQDYLYLVDDRVHKALRLINKSISEQVLKKWFEHVKTNLEWNKQDRRIFEKEYKEQRIDIPFILPHEFLYLVCNTIDRLEWIQKMHKTTLKSSKFSQMYQWELSDGKSIKVMQDQKQFRNLHLLNEDARINKAPQNLLLISLKKLEEGKQYSDFIGMDPKKDGKILAVVEQAQKLEQEQILRSLNQENQGNFRKQSIKNTKNTQKDIKYSKEKLKKQGNSQVNFSSQKDQNLNQLKNEKINESFDQDLDKATVDIGLKSVELVNTFEQSYKLMNNFKNFVKISAQKKQNTNEMTLVQQKKFQIQKQDLQAASLIAQKKLQSSPYGAVKLSQYQSKNPIFDSTKDQKNDFVLQQVASSKVNKFKINDEEKQKSPDAKKQNKEFMIQASIPDQKQNQKRLISAVVQEQKVMNNPQSTFIEENKTQFMNVSRLNVKRAEQIHQQFIQKRKLVFNQLNKGYKNQLKIDSSENQLQQNSQNINNYGKLSMISDQKKKRPTSAYGGVIAPPRNIKRLVYDENENNNKQKEEKLKQLLSHLAVIKDDESIQQITSQKQKEYESQINKKALLNNWINDEMSRYEESQKHKFQQPSQMELNLKIIQGSGVYFNKNNGRLNSCKTQNNFFRVQSASRQSLQLQRPSDKVHQHSQRNLYKINTEVLLNIGGSQEKFDNLESSQRNNDNNQMIAISQYTQQNKDNYSYSNQAGQNNIKPDAFRRLMMVKPPKESAQRQRNYAILSQNFSKVNVKQLVALQSGLGQGAFNLNGGQDASGSYSNKGLANTKNMISQSIGSNLRVFTANKRNVSAYQAKGVNKSMKFSDHYTQQSTVQ